MIETPEESCESDSNDIDIDELEFCNTIELPVDVIRIPWYKRYLCFLKK